MRCLGCWRRRRRKCSASADGQGAASPAAAGCGLPARREPALVSRGSTAMLPPAAAQQRLGGRSLPGVKQSWWRVASAPGVCVCKRGSSHKTKCPPSHGPACVQGQMAARRLCFNMVRLWLHGGTLAAAGEDRRGQAGPLVASTAAVGAACVGCRRSAWCPRWRGHHGGVHCTRSAWLPTGGEAREPGPGDRGDNIATRSRLALLTVTR